MVTGFGKPSNIVRVEDPVDVACKSDLLANLEVGQTVELFSVSSKSDVLDDFWNPENLSKKNVSPIGIGFTRSKSVSLEGEVRLEDFGLKARLFPVNPENPQLLLVSSFSNSTGV